MAKVFFRHLQNSLLHNGKVSFVGSIAPHAAEIPVPLVIHGSEARPMGDEYRHEACLDTLRQREGPIVVASMSYSAAIAGAYPGSLSSSVFC